MSAPRMVLAGERFGRLTVTRDRVSSEPRIACRCDCGTEVNPQLQNLASGRTTSCGCTRRGEGNHRWNGAPKQHPLYDTWRGMKERCFSPANKRYADYGGRGITVCDRWRDDFWAFVADMGERPDGHSLDRIDNDRGYEPGNVRWATASQQNYNQRARIPADQCVHGHDLTPENTRINQRGDRTCRTCDRQRARTYRARKAVSA